MITDYLVKIISQESLTFDEAKEVMGKIMSGQVNNAQIASLLTALKMKGESPEEVAGFVQAMRDTSERVVLEENDLIDVCGTGVILQEHLTSQLRWHLLLPLLVIE